MSTKQQILMILFQNPSEFISGQAISDKIGCSRTAVWKQIKELEKDGYTIESVQKRGYRLTKTPNKLSEAEIKAGLNTDSFGQKIVYESSVTSTQKLAHHIAEDGAQEGTLVVADEQVSGRARLGRSWHSPKGTGIWMSIILRPDLPLNKIPQLTLATAVAIVKAVKKATGVECQIKWPNDIMHDGKKLVGILTELQAEENRAKAVIIGMGMNVNLSNENIPDEIKDIATSIQILTGKTCSRAMLIQAIMMELELIYRLYLSEGFGIIKMMWETYAINIGKNITARKVNGETVKGLAQGITEVGFFLIKDSDDQIHHIYSADIEFDL